ncbi:hypothetical protein SK128_015814 [Halocaridina rubra]|uniref:Uncharacterized protein n=1 Tax=Halocaridina rubra TaxID=373956 RepID=A0AAN9AEZ7_HALRR
MAYQNHGGPFMNQVDLCILACDACYKGESLLMCANTCIRDGGKMALKWGSTCQYFINGRN